MSRYSLVLEQVILPPSPGGWPEPFDLRLGASEFLLIEGAGPEDSQALFDVAATLSDPVQGRVRLWDQEPDSLTRQELYRLRRHIAYINPNQPFLHNLTLGENIGMVPAYHFGMTLSAILQDHASLIEILGLGTFLSAYPSQLSGTAYVRAIWAREMIKLPSLILAIVEESSQAKKTQQPIFTLLQDYLAEQRVPVILAGESLATFHPLAHRILTLDSGQIRERQIMERGGGPLIAYLPLI